LPLASITVAPAGAFNVFTHRRDLSVFDVDGTILDVAVGHGHDNAFLITTSWRAAGGDV